MSTSRKIIKFFSILTLVGGLLRLIAGILIGIDMWDNASMVVGVSPIDGELGGVAIGIMGAVEGIWAMAIGWIGIKGANNPTKIGGFIVITAIAFVYYAFFFVMNFVGGGSGFDGTSFVGTIWNLIALVMGFSVKKEARR